MEFRNEGVCQRHRSNQTTEIIEEKTTEIVEEKGASEVTSVEGETKSGLFEGRIGRGSYFFRLILVNVGLVIILGMSVGGGGDSWYFECDNGDIIYSQYVNDGYPDCRDGSDETGSRDIGILLAIPLIIYSISLGVRRLHDLDKSGWVLLAPVLAGLIPALGTIVLAIFGFYLLLTKGTEGPNSFGPDPLTATTNEEE